MTKSVLLLQGPLGDFFKKLELSLREFGCETTRVAFNGGDRLYSLGDAICFNGDLDKWENVLTEIIISRNIDICVVYGDLRPYHKVAKRVSEHHNVDFIVLEEGYLRPDFVTVEEGGVNANSHLFSSKEALLSDSGLESFQSRRAIGKTFKQRAIFAINYYFYRLIGIRDFNQNIHHRDKSTISEGICWIKGYMFKLSHYLPDKLLMRTWVKRNSGRVFLIPLQVYNDSQITQHSPYLKVADFIEDVLASFAKFGSPEDVLLIKHHPMDRGYQNYKGLIDSLANEYRLLGRVKYGSEFKLPDLYKHLKGVVVVNSTVGLSALHHSVPTICLGSSLYDIEGVTFQGPLELFWIKPCPIEKSTISVLGSSLRIRTQVWGSFYKDSEYLIRAMVLKISSFKNIKKQKLKAQKAAIPTSVDVFKKSA